MVAKLKKLLIGESLRTEALKHEKFNVLGGLPILSSDPISSVAYAGEEILWVLIPVIGVLSYKYMFYIALAIVFLLIFLVFSYRQTIDNYPNGGGSYIVSRENLGRLPSLVAAASLTIDYILTVAVSTSAGAAAITSAFPNLLEHSVSITLLLIIIMTIGNLRGMKESAKIFSAPTYLFILAMGAMIIIGIVKVKVLGYVPEAAMEIPKVSGQITAFLLIKAFAAGCTALTGVEAVSDGVPNFREPAQKNAKAVLMLMATLVLFIFGGLSYLATLYHAVPNHEVTVVSQIASAVFGNGTFMFYAVQTTTAFILVMAANTAYADLPLLLSVIAKDGYAPRQFAKRGNRLSFDNGIMMLGLISGFLIVIFHGDTHSLLPLYAVGVFISFTLSQSGMFLKWMREKKPGWKHKAVINGTGATITFATVIIIGITKFTNGAWIVTILIPIMVFCMLKIKEHYNSVAEQLRLPLEIRPKKIACSGNHQHIIVPINTLNKSFLKALNYASELSNNIVAFHVSVEDAATEKLKNKWKEYSLDIPLVIKYSPYRDIIHPLVEFIDSEEHMSQPGDIITVIMPQFVVDKWWHNILHNQTTLFIKGLLFKRRNIAVVTLPYIIKD